MLYLKDKTQLRFQFPEVHKDAQLTVEIWRTMRVPDDGREYPLPAALDCFQIDHVDDHAERVPLSWVKHGGLMIPMYQSEAAILSFKITKLSQGSKYPFAVKIGTGKINVITGAGWSDKLQRKPQDYVVAPKQEWLDGFVVDDVVRQFVAMPLGKGYTVEEQITNCARWGGLQIQVFPMKREAFDERYPVPKPYSGGIRYSMSSNPSLSTDSLWESLTTKSSTLQRTPDMGVAPGGRIRQQIFADDFQASDWDLTQTSRCFIHLCNSAQWEAITGEKPPSRPITPRQYREAGLPWFKHYKEKARRHNGRSALASLASVAGIAETNGDPPPSDNMMGQEVAELHSLARTIRERGK